MSMYITFLLYGCSGGVVASSTQTSRGSHSALGFQCGALSRSMTGNSALPLALWFQVSPWELATARIQRLPSSL
ncbi:hypothetical protein FQZ97_1213710 [compost metagenome]